MSCTILPPFSMRVISLKERIRSCRSNVFLEYAFWGEIFGQGNYTRNHKTSFPLKRWWETLAVYPLTLNLKVPSRIAADDTYFFFLLLP